MSDDEMATLRAVAEAAELVTPCGWSVDNYIVNPGDGGGNWYLYDYDSGEDDPPLAIFNFSVPERLAKHAAAFDPPTALRLLDELAALRSALSSTLTWLPVDHADRIRKVLGITTE